MLLSTFGYIHSSEYIPHSHRHEMNSSNTNDSSHHPTMARVGETIPLTSPLRTAVRGRQGRRGGRGRRGSRTGMQSSGLSIEHSNLAHATVSATAANRNRSRSPEGQHRQLTRKEYAEYLKNSADSMDAFYRKNNENNNTQERPEPAATRQPVQNNAIRAHLLRDRLPDYEPTDYWRRKEFEAMAEALHAHATGETDEEKAHNLYNTLDRYKEFFGPYYTPQACLYMVQCFPIFD